MDIKQLIKQIEQNDVKDVVVRKYGKTFEVYPWLKPRLFNVLVLGEEVMQRKDITLFLKQIASLFYGFFSYFKRYDAWAFTTSLERIPIEGKYFDKVVDSLMMNKPHRLLVIELKLFKSYKRRNVASKHVISRALFMFTEELYLRLFLRKVNIEGKEVLKQVEKTANAAVNVNSIVKKYLAQYRVMKFFLAIFPKPKVVFITVSYANFGYIRAWKESGIKVVELQHGLIGESHTGYVFEQTFNPIQFPDDLLVFGENEKTIIKQVNFPVQNIIPVGRFVMDYYFQRAIPNRVPVQTILVSLQDTEWSIALLNFIFACNQQLDRQLTWIIQPRRTSEDVYRKEFQFPENICFSKLSIYDAIANADAHLTIFSTTAVESLSIGKPTFLYDYKQAATTYLGELLSKNENAYFCEDVDSFVHQINQLSLRTTKEIADSNAMNISSAYSDKISTYIDSLFDEQK